MKKVVVTGAAGFAGYNLTKRLADFGYLVYAVVRPESVHNLRLSGISGVTVVECDMSGYDILASKIGDSTDLFFHMTWSGGRYDFNAQLQNQNAALKALEQAAALGCRKFISAGSQAEYGVSSGIISENNLPDPFCDYGAAKIATCYLTKKRAQELGIEWVWGRIFSLYGRYEPGSRMLPHLIGELKKYSDISLSSCRQNWDYLYAEDAADAFIALGERGRNGEIYNVANGDYRPLKEYVVTARDYFKSESKITYGEDPDPFVSLQPSVEKIRNDTGWEPEVSFEKGLELISGYDYGNE